MEQIFYKMMYMRMMPLNRKRQLVMESSDRSLLQSAPLPTWHTCSLGQPSYKKDGATLALIALHRSEVQLDHRRHRGVWHEYPHYTMAKHILFVWAGVHKPERKQSEYLYSEDWPELADCFIELHAETQQEGLPEIYLRY